MKKRQSPDELLLFLETCWPGRRTKKIKEVFSKLKRKLKQPVLKTRKPSARKTGYPARGDTFNILDVVRCTCAAHDFSFLSRQITYHIAATADLPKVIGDVVQYEAILSELLGYITKHAPHGSRIDIEIKETKIRRSSAVEIIFKSIDEKLINIDKTQFIENLLVKPSSEFSQIKACKNAISKEGGKFICDLPEPKRPLFRVILPTVTTTCKPTSDHILFKYNISIRNIANVRKRFGIKKSESLVSQVETFVRSLLRHPVDMVTSTNDKGIITAIYETQKGAAQSVATRVSTRLCSEKFHIGKKEVELEFSYNLSAIPPALLKQRTG